MLKKALKATVPFAIGMFVGGIPFIIAMIMCNYEIMVVINYCISIIVGVLAGFIFNLILAKKESNKQDKGHNG